MGRAYLNWLPPSAKLVPVTKGLPPARLPMSHSAKREPYAAPTLCAHGRRRGHAGGCAGMRGRAKRRRNGGSSEGAGAKSANGFLARTPRGPGAGAQGGRGGGGGVHSQIGGGVAPPGD